MSVRTVSVVTALLFAVPLLAQSDQYRQTDALLVLSSANSATNWAQASQVSTAVVSGTVRTANGLPRQFVMKVRGREEFRFEFPNDPNLPVTVISGQASALNKSTGSRPMVAGWALTARPPILPFLTDISRSSEVAVSVSSAGTAQVGRDTALGVRINRSIKADDPLASVRTSASEITVWISAVDWLPVAIDYVRLGSQNSSVITRCRRLYSDYRVVGGLAVPFHQEEYVDGELSSITELEQVRFNESLSDSDFTVPSRSAGVTR